MRRTRQLIKVDRLAAHFPERFGQQTLICGDVDGLPPRLFVGPRGDEILVDGAGLVSTAVTAVRSLRVEVHTFSCHQRFVREALAAIAVARGRSNRATWLVGQLVEACLTVDELVEVTGWTPAYISQHMAIAQPVAPVSEQARYLCGALTRAFQDGMLELDLARQVRPLLTRAPDHLGAVLQLLETALNPSSGRTTERATALSAALTGLLAEFAPPSRHPRQRAGATTGGRFAA